VFGASVLLAEGASQKPQNGIRTRGSQGPDDSQGHDADMAHQRGGFKVNSAISGRAVKRLHAERVIWRPYVHGLFRIQTDQNSCNKFSQNTVIA
jgi:hypothetical protein